MARVPPVAAMQPFAGQDYTLISFKATLPSLSPSHVPGPRCCSQLQTRRAQAAGNQSQQHSGA